MNNTYLVHHGIAGQKWGDRNGPPYPLDSEDHSKTEKIGKKLWNTRGEKINRKAIKRYTDGNGELSKSGKRHYGKVVEAKRESNKYESLAKKSENDAKKIFRKEYGHDIDYFKKYEAGDLYKNNSEYKKCIDNANEWMKRKKIADQKFDKYYKKASGYHKIGKQYLNSVLNNVDLNKKE